MPIYPERKKHTAFATSKIAQNKFLRNLRKFSGNVTRAARASSVTRQTVFNLRKASEEFEEKYQEVMSELVDNMEEAAYKRAVDGVQKPVYQGGKRVGTVIEYSDPILKLMLAANLPEKYGNKSSVEISGKDGGPIAIEDQAKNKLSQLLGLSYGITVDHENDG